MTTATSKSQTASSNVGIATLGMLSLDCSDPSPMAAFYAGVLGWEVSYDDGESAAMITDGTNRIGFGKIENYVAPEWNDAAVKRYHLDLYVADLDEAEAALTARGAGIADPQPDPEHWRVMLDPAGHPFCICPTPES